MQQNVTLPEVKAFRSVVNSFSYHASRESLILRLGMQGTIVECVLSLYRPLKLKTFCDLFQWVPGASAQFSTFPLVFNMDRVVLVLLEYVASADDDHIEYFLRRQPPASLRSWTQLHFADKPVINAWDRLWFGVACRTGVNFWVFKTNRGESETSPKHESREEREKIWASSLARESRFALASLSPLLARLRCKNLYLWHWCCEKIVAWLRTFAYTLISSRIF